MRYQRDERSWASRLTDLHQNWKPLVEGITNAYLRWKYDDPDGVTSEHRSQVPLDSDIVDSAQDPPLNRPTEDPAAQMSPPQPSDDSATPLDPTDIEITVIDIYTLSTSIKLSRVDEETTAVALAGLGFIGNAPFKPSVAISMKTLELYRLLRRRKASFSIEGFVKVICDLYNVGYYLCLFNHLLILWSRSHIVASIDDYLETRSIYIWKLLGLWTTG